MVQYEQKLTLKCCIEAKGSMDYNCVTVAVPFGTAVFMRERGRIMETRVAVISIILEDSRSTPQVNSLLSEYGDYIVGRMGIPYKKRGISIISIVIDSPQDVISALSGRLGKLDGVSAKAAYSKYTFNDDE